ncbi:MAG: hypothetical protein GYB26_00030 [Gammaproteobacteria bacterium]|nr:hypothetical protein [Gammaproteobacteria bacterium]
MAGQRPNWKVGSAYRIQLRSSNDAQKNLLICRLDLAGISAEFWSEAQLEAVSLEGLHQQD